MKKHFQWLSLTLYALAMAPGVAQAESFDSLVKKGYKISGLSKSKGGNPGWKLTKDREVFFCGMKGVGVMKHGRNGLIMFSASGRTITLDKETYLNGFGWKEMPKGTLDYADIKAGRITGRVVKNCLKY